jgi:hypothetical protein
MAVNDDDDDVKDAKEREEKLRAGGRVLINVPLPEYIMYPPEAGGFLPNSISWSRNLFYGCQRCQLH